MKNLFFLLILSAQLFAADTTYCVLDPGTAVITKDTVFIILDPPPTLDVKKAPKTNWSKLKDLFL